jgi:hypothetical protein
MFAFLPQPEHMPCSECGASVARADADAHSCEEERRLDYQLLQLRDEVEGFQDDVSAYLSSPRGRFDLWCAERDRERRPPR